MLCSISANSVADDRTAAIQDEMTLLLKVPPPAPTRPFGKSRPILA